MWIFSNYFFSVNYSKRPHWKIRNFKNGGLLTHTLRIWPETWLAKARLFKTIITVKLFFCIAYFLWTKNIPTKNFLITTNFVKNTAASPLTFYFESKYWFCTDFSYCNIFVTFWGPNHLDIVLWWQISIKIQDINRNF